MHEIWLASFPGPTQLSVAWSTEKQDFCVRLGEPGNEAKMWFFVFKKLLMV